MTNPTLVRAFRALNDEQKANLRWHLAAGTRILCGAEASWFARNGGG